MMNPIKQRTLALLVCLATWSVDGEMLPNMVFLMTDDQGWGDVGYNGHPKIKTPHLDDMAKSGLRFDRFYAGASVCSPTRASCMTGRCNWRVSINDPSRADEEHLPQEEITLPEALKAKGYATGHFGKWHLGGFDEKMAKGPVHVMPPWKAGFEECFSTFNVLVTHDPYAKIGKHGIEGLYWHNGRNIPFEEAQKDPTLRGDDAAIVMNKAIPFIREQAKAKKPFLAVIWFHNVHPPLGKNPELMKQYADCSVKEQIYYSNITAVDTQVGALRRALRELEIADNTMVWFTSDNGPNLKGKKEVMIGKAQGGKFTYTPLGSTGAYRGWKRYLYEGGILMPGILEWPGRIKKPFVTDIPAVTSDYFPTALAAANIPLPNDRDYDGINLLPLIDGKMKKRKGIGFHCRGMQAWVEHRYKVIRLTSKKREPNPWELYDLLADPFEEKDLAKELPEVVRRMEEEFTVWATSVQADEQKVLDKYHSTKTKKKKSK